MYDHTALYDHTKGFCVITQAGVWARGLCAIIHIFMYDHTVMYGHTQRMLWSHNESVWSHKTVWSHKKICVTTQTLVWCDTLVDFTQNSVWSHIAALYDQAACVIIHNFVCVHTEMCDHTSWCVITHKLRWKIYWRDHTYLPVSPYTSIMCAHTKISRNFCRMITRIFYVWSHTVGCVVTHKILIAWSHGIYVWSHALFVYGHTRVSRDGIQQHAGRGILLLYQLVFNILLYQLVFTLWATLC